VELVLEGGEEELHYHALLVEVEWATQVAKWIANSIKTAGIGNEKEAGDPNDPTKEPPKKVRSGFREKKWEEEEKREGGRPR
jgi:hypothetical protein